MLAAWLFSLAGAFGVGAYVNQRPTRTPPVVRSVQLSQHIETNLYNLGVQLIAVPAEGRDGGIAPLGNGLLFANRKGRLWYVDSAKSLRALNLRIPINIPEFEADPYNASTERRDRFAVKDILVQTIPSGVRILASYNHWYSEKDCYTLRVSSIETSFDGLMAGTVPATWKTVFESHPCHPLIQEGKHWIPTHEAGGRLLAVSKREILITVGVFQSDVETTEGFIEGPDVNSSYGKTILFNLATGASRVFTRGHRNPQGLAATADGKIWLTEHASRGGDELNRLVQRKDYGFPHVSYGTKYNSMTWPGNPQLGRHEGYEKPTYAWVPSIGISELIVIEGSAFPFWKGDLMVSSLLAETLYRLRIEDGRAIYAEPIPIGHRIRDIAETADGSIVLKTDDNFLVFLEPAAATDPTSLPRNAGGLKTSSAKP
jgi:hypothetical protein